MDLSKLNTYRTLLPSILERVLNDEGASLLEASVIKYMNLGKNPDVRHKSQSDKIYINTGKLARSFKRTQATNFFKVTSSLDSTKLEYGSNIIYARIHEYGSGSLQRPKNIPSRHYFEPGMQYFNDNFLPKLVDKFIKELLEKIGLQ